MKRTTVLLVVPLLLLAGCKSSTRTIQVKDGLFSIGEPAVRSGYVAYAFSKDGSKMCAIKDLWGDEPTVQVLSREDDAVLAEYKVTAHSWFPVMFTDDAQGLVVASQGGAVQAKTIRIGEDLPPETEGDEGLVGSAFNHDFTMLASTSGVVVTNTGAVAKADVVEATPAFDQFGNVWYRTASGKWVSVDREGHVVPSASRPAYLVTDPQHHRGGMHLSDSQQTMEFEHAQAFVTAVWLHHDKAIGGVDERRNPRNTAALVHVGADLNDYAFVPGRNEIAVFDAEGTRFVPYSTD